MLLVGPDRSLVHSLPQQPFRAGQDSPHDRRLRHLPQQKRKVDTARLPESLELSVVRVPEDGVGDRAGLLRRDILRRHGLQDAHILRLLDGLARVVIRADSRPARADRIEEVQLVEVQCRHFQQRQLRVREGRLGIVEEVVLAHTADPSGCPVAFNPDPSLLRAPIRSLKSFVLISFRPLYAVVYMRFPDC